MGVFLWARYPCIPLKWRGGAYAPTAGPLGFNSPNIAQRHALHVERTAEKAVMLSDCVELSSAEARVEEIKGGSVGMFELSHPARARTHTQNALPTWCFGALY